MIRHADPSEAEALAALHRSSITAHCSAAYTDAQINAWTAMLRPEAYSALIRDAAVLVVTDDAENRLVGVGVCSPEIGLINATYVERSNTRRGVGRTLMNAMESLLLDAGRREARLDATLNALAFYRSQQARQGGRSRRHRASRPVRPGVRPRSGSTRWGVRRPSVPPAAL